MKTEEFKPHYCDQIPPELEEGTIYISHKFQIAIHLCACGCKEQAVTPLGSNGWTLTDTDGKITLRPSIGNWIWENPYHAHYFITNSKAIFV